MEDVHRARYEEKAQCFHAECSHSTRISVCSPAQKLPGSFWVMEASHD